MLGYVQAVHLCWLAERAQMQMLAAPTTHFVAVAQAILYRGAGFAIVWPQFQALFAIGSAFLGSC